MTREQAVRIVYDWQYNNTGSFYNLLMVLFQKADQNNRRKLNEAYPEIAATLDDWNGAGDCGNDLFREYGLMPSKDSER